MRKKTSSVKGVAVLLFLLHFYMKRTLKLTENYTEKVKLEAHCKPHQRFVLDFQVARRLEREDPKKFTEYYKYMIQNHFYDFLSNWRFFPRHTDFFDLMEYMPVLGDNCPRSHMKSMLEDPLIEPKPDPSVKKQIAFMITAHKNSSRVHIRNFIERLNHPSFAFFITIDIQGQMTIQDMQEMFKDNPNVYYITRPRMKIIWGEISQVHAMLATVNAILTCGMEFDFISFHSGDDVALRTGAHVKEFFDKYGANNEFIEFDLPPFDKVHRYRLDNIFSAHVSDCANENSLLEMRRSLRSIFPNWQNTTKWPLLYGSQWWTLSTETLRRVIKFVESEDPLITRITFTRIPDEVFMQMVLMKIGLNGRNLCNYMRYINFNLEYLVLADEHIRTAFTGNHLFARKAHKDIPSIHDVLAKLVTDNPDFPSFLKPECQPFPPSL